MIKTIFLVVILVVQATYAEAQLHLSPVNTGDCVAARITAKRTAFVDEFYKKYCAEHNPDKLKERKCVENTRASSQFSFFTDRCSESDYFIGVNGKEFKLSRISKKPGKPIDFIGSFAGNGISIAISNPRLLKKIYTPGEARDESYVEDAEYKVDVTVTKETLTKTFKDVILWYGR
ncbi:MAG: hypothetical protein JWQ09_125 [Segetibacter sp.]|nr:hypothetical protein [Segetibacter sp.]